MISNLERIYRKHPPFVNKIFFFDGVVSLETLEILKLKIGKVCTRLQ